MGLILRRIAIHSFDKNIEDYLKLKRLDPSYRVFFDDGHIDVPANYQELKDLFESMEEGSGENLDLFISQAEKKYKVGIQNLVYKPGLSIKEFIDKDTITGVFKGNKKFVVSVIYTSDKKLVLQGVYLH